MGATTKLSVSELTVTPGGEAGVDVLVENTGSVVDEFAVEALGDAAIWAESSPPSVRLLPGGEATVKVAFRPPREAATSAGVAPFAVRVSSQEDPEGTVVEEGMLTIEPFAEASADLLPTASHGRRRAKYYVALDNRGNSPLTATVLPADPTGELKFKVRPPELDVEPDAAAFSELVAIPRRRFWRGTAKPRPFTVSVNRADQPSLAFSGTMLQEPLVPGWAWVLALALIGLLVAAPLLWPLMKPAVQSTAKRAVEAAVNVPLSKNDDALKSQGEALKQQSEAQKQQGDAMKKLDDGLKKQDDAAKKQDEALKKQDEAIKALQAGNPPPRPPGNALGAPFDTRLDSKNSAFAVKKGATLSVTDVFFENVNNDTGQISLARDPGDGSGARDLKLEKLDNFRDLDLHFVSPITLTEGQSLRLALDKCQKGQGSSASGCSASVYITGYLKS